MKINTMFLDTNIFLSNNLSFLDQCDFFYISNITIEELENIKNSHFKDEYIKYNARKAVHWLVQHPQKYEVEFFDQEEIRKYFKSSLPFSIIDSNDKKIILTALYISYHVKDLTFYTQDLSCYLLAKNIANLNSIYYTDNSLKKYKGYTNIYCSSEEELGDLYTKIGTSSFEEGMFNINQYILIYDENNNLIDKYKYTKENRFQPIQYTSCESKMFGKVKPKDVYQEMALDSFKNNKITLIKGPAGSGKSLLSLSYLFSLLEENKIDRIIIFCNTVATVGSAKLGYYPGDRVEKLLDSQIGNFLISKIGARQGVQRLIAEESLLLLPMSDIRGFDTTGMRAGIYITEAQNLSIDLMKLALQRVGEDSFCILDGDFYQQVDLPVYAGNNNGLRRVSEVFRNHSFYGQVELKTVYRSQIAALAQQM